VARLPLVEKANQELKDEKVKIEKDYKLKIDSLNADLQSKESANNSLQAALSTSKAEYDHLKEHELKAVKDKVDKWESTFPNKTPYEVEIEFNKPKITKEQEDKVNNYDKIKGELDE